jgi:HupE / UreJ protein
VLSMLAVGFFAAHLGGRAIWLAPLSFVTVMALGGELGVACVKVPLVEIGIGLSLLSLGSRSRSGSAFRRLPPWPWSRSLRYFMGTRTALRCPTPLRLDLRRGVCMRDRPATCSRCRARAGNWLRRREPSHRSGGRRCYGACWRGDPGRSPVGRTICHNLKGKIYFLTSKSAAMPLWPRNSSWARKKLERFGTPSALRSRT